MLRSMYSAVSGVKAHQTYLDVTGNNIANVNTVGFKRDVIHFRDMIYQTVKNPSQPNPAIPIGGVNPAQVGLGVAVGSIETVHVQGSMQTTGIPTDMAIQGQGFFVVQNGPQRLFTRAGNFALDKNGNLVMQGNGYLVQGYAYNNGVLSSSLSDINIPIGAKTPANATTIAAFRCNLSCDGNPSIADLTSIPGGSAAIPRPHDYIAFGGVQVNYIGINDPNITPPPVDARDGQTYFSSETQEIYIYRNGAWAYQMDAADYTYYYGVNLAAGANGQYERIYTDGILNAPQGVAAPVNGGPIRPDPNDLNPLDLFLDTRNGVLLRVEYIPNTVGTTVVVDREGQTVPDNVVTEKYEDTFLARSTGLIHEVIYKTTVHRSTNEPKSPVPVNYADIGAPQIGDPGGLGDLYLDIQTGNLYEHDGDDWDPSSFETTTSDHYFIYDDGTEIFVYRGGSGPFRVSGGYTVGFENLLGELTAIYTFDDDSLDWVRSEDVLTYDDGTPTAARLFIGVIETGNAYEAGSFENPLEPDFAVGNANPPTLIETFNGATWESIDLLMFREIPGDIGTAYYVNGTPGFFLGTAQGLVRTDRIHESATSLNYTSWNGSAFVSTPIASLDGSRMGPVVTSRQIVDYAQVLTYGPSGEPDIPPNLNPDTDYSIRAGSILIDTNTGRMFQLNSTRTRWVELNQGMQPETAYGVRADNRIFMLDSVGVPTLVTEPMDVSTGSNNIFYFSNGEWISINNTKEVQMSLSPWSGSTTTQEIITEFGENMIASHDYEDKFTVYDSKGNAHTMVVTFRKVMYRPADPNGTPPTGAETEWDWYAYYADNLGNQLPQFGQGAGTMVFGDDGLLKRTYTYQPEPPATPNPNATNEPSAAQYAPWEVIEKIVDPNDPSYNSALHDPLPTGLVIADFNVAGAQGSVVGSTYASNMITLDFLGKEYAATLGLTGDRIDGVTSYGGASTTKMKAQDGYAMGELNNWSVGADGTIVGSYSNGRVLPIARIALAMFANPQGLEKMGETTFAMTINSGEAIIGDPMTGGAGSVIGNTIEMSNVDLSEEFVNLIRAQRGFQANTRVVTTSDQVLEELINMKR